MFPKMPIKPLFLAGLIFIVLWVTAACGSAVGPKATVTTLKTDQGEDTSQDTVVNLVEKSDAAQAKAPKLGATITGTEEVTTPRTHLGGEYHDVSTSDAVSFHPYLTTDTASGSYQGLVYTGGLLRLDPDTLEYIPNMAESYSISKDGLTFTFHLRRDMKWSDGMPITAHDFEWTYQQAKNPDNEFPYLSQLDFIQSFRALDDYTLEVKIDKVYAPALGQISGLITPLPQHVWEKYPWSDPDKNPEINHPTVVSGPYQLVEWKRDEHAIFEANPNYWYHGAPNISRYVIEIVPDQDIAYEKFKAGESDTAPITPENLDEARQLPNATVYEWWPAAAQWSYIGLNQRDGFPTHDINVRHGLNYAIDKNALTDAVMLGQAKRLCSIYLETSWAYNPDVPCYDYNQDQALAAFDQAGGTYDTAVRKEKYQEIQKIIAQDSPYIFLFYNKPWSGQNNRIQGIEPGALGIGWNSEDWYIRDNSGS